MDRAIVDSSTYRVDVNLVGIVAHGVEVALRFLLSKFWNLEWRVEHSLLFVVSLMWFDFDLI